MKKIVLFLLVLSATLPLTAQRISIDTDIFGDLRYRSSDPDYTASLKKDIFDNLTFTDSRRNKIVFEEDYLKEKYPAVLTDTEAKIDFFRGIVNRHHLDKGYEATFSVDIFGTIEMKDNLGNTTKEKTDIFGNKSYEETGSGKSSSIRRGLNGTLEYRSGGTTASLEKSTFGRDKWVYEDSTGNRFEFSNWTWTEMVNRFGNDEQIFIFLIDEFLALS